MNNYSPSKLSIYNENPLCKDAHKDYIARVSVSPNLDLEKHKEVFELFVREISQLQCFFWSEPKQLKFIKKYRWFFPQNDNM